MNQQPAGNATPSVREGWLVDEIDCLRSGITSLIQPYLTRSGNSDVGDLARSIRHFIEQRPPVAAPGFGDAGDGLPDQTGE